MVLSMAVPRVTVALAQAETGKASRGVLTAFAKMHPRFGTPANAVLLQTGMALVILSLGAFDRILVYIIFPSVVFLALTAATLFRVIKPVKHPGDQPEGSRFSPGTPVRRWWYPLAPVVFIAGSGVLGVMLLLHNPGAALLGAGIVLCGLPLRWMLNRRSGTDPDSTVEAPSNEELIPEP
jgi:APA family basic amino acid/polyamine antiporter